MTWADRSSTVDDVTGRKSAEERTADLLEAAETILERNRRATVSEIAREAGIASGTFYLYFPSKSHLEAALIDRYLSGMVEQARLAADPRQPAIRQVEAILTSIVDHALAHVAIVRLQVAHAPAEATRGMLTVHVEELVDLLGQVLADGESINDPVVTASLVFHGIDGYLRGAIAFDSEVDADRLVRAAMGMCGSMLEPASADR